MQVCAAVMCYPSVVSKCFPKRRIYNIMITKWSTASISIMNRNVFSNNLKPVATKNKGKKMFFHFHPRIVYQAHMKAQVVICIRNGRDKGLRLALLCHRASAALARIVIMYVNTCLIPQARQRDLMISRHSLSVSIKNKKAFCSLCYYQLKNGEVLF